MRKEFLNARYLLCPLPVIRVQDKVKTMAAGEILEVVCTDPGALQDIPAWCRINGHRILETENNDQEFAIVVQVGT